MKLLKSQFIAYKNGKQVDDINILSITPRRDIKNQYLIYISHKNKGRVYSTETLGTSKFKYDPNENELTYIWEGEYDSKNNLKYKKISYTFKFLNSGLWNKIINQKSTN